MYTYSIRRLWLIHSDGWFKEPTNIVFRYNHKTRPIIGSYVSCILRHGKTSDPRIAESFWPKSRVFVWKSEIISCPHAFVWKSESIFIHDTYTTTSIPISTNCGKLPVLFPQVILLLSQNVEKDIVILRTNSWKEINMLWYPN